MVKNPVVRKMKKETKVVKRNKFISKNKIKLNERGKNSS